jgi:isoaspartyl peptidase/L-asparaginase-like protein (Ntn-hydrolase superfamily)
MQNYFIAVHAGAGYHGASKEAAYKSALQAALAAAAQCLDAGGTSFDGVKSAVCALEVRSVVRAHTYLDGCPAARNSTTMCDHHS